MKGVYNIDSNHHMNIQLLDGRIGELKIRYKQKVILEQRLKELREKGVNPLSFDDGRYFVFSRVVAGRDTTFDVQVYQETVDVPGYGQMKRDMISKVGPDVLARLEKEGFDLYNLFSKPTPEEIALIVSKSDLMTGRSPACDEIFDNRWKAEREARKAQRAPAQQGPSAPKTTYEQAMTGTASTQAAPATNLGTTTNPVTTTSTVPVTNGAPTQSTTAASTTTSFSTPAAPTATQATQIEEMSDEDFFKSIGVQA
jgi:hypothetical protein